MEASVMKKTLSCALLGTLLADPTAAAPQTGEFRFAVSPKGGEANWGLYDAVFVFSESTTIDPSVTAGFIGHPHLRTVIGKTAEEQAAALNCELNALTADVECEYKFLITFPDTDALSASPFAASAHIVQTYLLPLDNSTERVRMRERNGETLYTHTVKRRIDDLSCEEIESEITKAEYDMLLKRADIRKKPVEKTRWCILHEGVYFELDIYPFWADRAIVEIELSEKSDAPLPFPPYFRVIREVTSDLRYKNVRLADEVPMDPL
jgi:CYTH domain-containing protein